MEWRITDMGWRKRWNWKFSITPFGEYDERGRFHWNGAMQCWIGPLCITRLHPLPADFQERFDAWMDARQARVNRTP